MPMQTPKIDPRTYQEIVQQTEDLARDLSGWSPRKDKAPDGGAALIHIFARMVEVLTDRLNRMPDKNFLAFLDLIGARLQPPQAARVPLTFQLASGAPDDAFVPALTRVANVPVDGKAEILFETESDLVVTGTRLVAVFTQNPQTDQYADVSNTASGADEQPFPAFGGDWRLDQPIEHALYIADDALFTLPRPAGFMLRIDWKSAAPPFPDEPWNPWSIWDGAAWARLSAKTDVTEAVAGKGAQWMTTLSNPPIPQTLTLSGRSARWIRLAIPGPLSADAELPMIQQITLTELPTDGPRLIPEQGLANGSPVDLSKDFLPFGERPQLGDALYLKSNEVLSRGGAQVTVYLSLSSVVDSRLVSSPTLAWEMWDGSDWQGLTAVSGKAARGGMSGPENLMTSGTVIFDVPDWSRIGTVAGVTGNWVRIRLEAGNYGTEPVYLPVLDTNGQLVKDAKGQQTYTLQQGGYSPPRLRSLRLNCAYFSLRAPVACLSGNDFRYKDHSTDPVFAPFTPTPEVNPALYLGFDRPFSNRPVKLYIQVEPEPYDVKISPNPGALPPTLIWEYAAEPPNRAGDHPIWKNLTVEDGTRALVESGLVAFIGPQDPGTVAVFDRSACWLRARWVSGSYQVPPRLRRVLTNTVWAAQASTVSNEVLGSSDGSPNQVFRTQGSPVMPNPEIEVREATLSAEDEAAIIALEGADAMTPIVTAGGQSQGVWARWHEMPDFYASKPNDRHYVFDPLSGDVHFGDGQHGHVPPVGPGNIRAARYRTGGGEQGNCPTGSLIQLKTALVSVASVANLEPAGGGADQGSLDQVKEHGPHILRHRGRSVASQDYEDLALQSSPEVARALPISPRFSPVDVSWIDPMSHPALERRLTGAGQVTLVIVPRGVELKPVPSMELINQVETFLRARCPPTVDLQVTGPYWIKVSVMAEIAPVSAVVAQGLVREVSARLQGFLHPLTGGTEGKGWDFGRRVYASDLYALIEAISGVDYVVSLDINAFDDQTERKGSDNLFDDLSADQLARLLIYSGDHQLSLAFLSQGA